MVLALLSNGLCMHFKSICRELPNSWIGLR